MTSFFFPFRGTGTYTLVLVEMILSYYTNWMTRNVKGGLWMVFPVLTVVMAASVVYKVSNSILLKLNLNLTYFDTGCSSREDVRRASWQS